MDMSLGFPPPFALAKVHMVGGKIQTQKLQTNQITDLSIMMCCLVVNTLFFGTNSVCWI